MTGEIIETGIQNLKIKINKVIGDERGVLCELVPQGIENPFVKEGIKNIYASMATNAKVARGGHYHVSNVENFYVLAGTALWFFKDFRKDSPTFEKTYTLLLSYDPKEDQDTPSFSIKQNQMAQVYVPSGVYHMYWPLTEKRVIVLAVASEPYKKEDYIYPDIKEDPKFKEITSKYELTFESK